MRKIPRWIYKKDENSLVLALKIFFAMLTLFFVAIVFATAIPNSWVNENAQQSIAVLRSEGNTSFSYSSQKNDGFSDNIMISMSESRSKQSMNVVEAAMEGSYVSNADPENPQARSYERFWHGYVVFLKPLLLLFDINIIRQLTILSFIVLVAVVAYQLAILVSRYVALAFIVSIAIFNPPVIMVNLEYFTTFAVMLLGSIALLYSLQRGVSRKVITSLFLVIGGTTIFFDFLTTPIITWGVPLIIYIAYSLKHGKLNAKKIWTSSVILSIAWLAGYALIWASKWMLASIILQRNIVKNAIETTSYYTSVEGDKGGASTLVYSLQDMYRLNAEYAALFLPILALSAIFCLFSLILLVKQRRISVQLLALVLLLSLIVLAPLVWMLFARSHSYIHHWMTNRNLIISIFGALVLSGFMWSKIRITKPRLFR